MDNPFRFYKVDCIISGQKTELGEVTKNMDKSDQEQRVLSKKAPKAPIHHSAVAEHFQGDFPLFINRWEEGFELREHDHAYLEIVYVMSGEGYHYVGEQVERTTKGCLYILPVGTSHILRPSGASAKSKLLVYNICILPEFINELKNWLSPYGNGGEALSVFDRPPGTHIALVDKSLEFGQWFDQLHREFNEKQLGFEASMFAGLMQLTVRVARLLKQNTSSGNSAHEARSRRSEITAVLEYINSHVTDRLTVEQLALEAGLSRRHFIRLFRLSAGMGFSDYVQLRRVEYSCRLLLETDHKIASIAKSTGYRDTTHFREVFRKIMGTSPHSYRRSNRN